MSSIHKTLLFSFLFHLLFLLGGGISSAKKEVLVSGERWIEFSNIPYRVKSVASKQKNLRSQGVRAVAKRDLEESSGAKEEGSGGGDLVVGEVPRGVLISNYFTKIRQKIAEELYESVHFQKIRQRNLILRVGVLPEGKIEEVWPERSSGNKLVDQRAIEVVRNINAFPPIPREIGKEKIIFRVPISFETI